MKVHLAGNIQYNREEKKKALSLSSEKCRNEKADFYHSEFTENMLNVYLKREEWPASWQPSEVCVSPLSRWCTQNLNTKPLLLSYVLKNVLQGITVDCCATTASAFRGLVRVGSISRWVRDHLVQSILLK